VTLGELVLTQEQPLVWSLDDGWRLVPRKLLRTFPSGIKPVFRLALASGHEVEATANHPFRTIDGWTRLDELEVGQHLAVPRRIPQPTTPVPSWDEDELVLLAHLLGDGSMGPNRVTYATPDVANKAAVEERARRRFGIEARGKQRGSTWQLWFPSPYRLTPNRHHPMRNWLEPLGLWGSRSNNTFIPESVFGLGDDQVALFMHHLWATHGSITINRNRRGEFVTVHYATASRALADGVRRLLARLDVRSRVSRARKTGYRDSWHVRIVGAPEIVRFLSAVGCYGARGACVPAALDALARVKPKPKHFDPSLVDIATSDVLWDEIVEITAIGEQPTFDATVDDTHNFIANGVIAHNSLEQDADVVLFLYRDELYNSESQDRGVAEVIVAKHRSGPTGTERLAFLDRFTRFANMARV
jgi:replicative DNA helicase